MNQYLILFNTNKSDSIDPLPVFKTSKKEAIQFLKDSGKEGWVYKTKAIAFSHKVEEVKVELIRKIKVEQPITLSQVGTGSMNTILNTEDEPEPFKLILRCFFCGNKATTVVDSKPLCKDCGGTT